MNNPFVYRPDAVCYAAFRELIARLEAMRTSERQEDVNFCRELDAGKMVGVLIAEDAQGARHRLYAFSGQLGDGGFHYPGFVGPVFDYLQPDGYFKRKEREISLQNKEIDLFEKGEYSLIKEAYERMAKRFDGEVAEFQGYCRLSKMERDAKRETATTNEKELAAMIRQSQFEKAELRRLKKRLAAELEPYAAKMQEAQSRLDAMKDKRRRESEALQQWLFSNFKLLNARGESRSLSEIFADTPMRIPPSGAGECCAPKLLQEAYRQDWQPIAMAEYWYGRPKSGELRIHGRQYPACRGKCGPVLRWMLQGLDVAPPLNSEINVNPKLSPEVIFENDWFCVVNKPSGMLSVPGKSATPSVEQWLAAHYSAGKEVRVAHRLDQDTSGLLIATFSREAYTEMQALFATRQVKKTYVADLDGNYETLGISQSGRISLPLIPDWLDRPRQLVDRENGKEAITDYMFISATANRSRIEFHPQTGRTHQLRVHSASDQGLGMPIVGDRLYGSATDYGTERLHLHAQKIEFTWPLNGQHYIFECPTPF